MEVKGRMYRWSVLIAVVVVSGCAGPTSGAPPSDAGTTPERPSPQIYDAGSPNNISPDAGEPIADAGAPSPADAGTPPPDGGAAPPADGGITPPPPADGGVVTGAPLGESCTNFTASGLLDPSIECSLSGAWCAPDGPSSLTGVCGMADGCDFSTQTGCGANMTCHPVGLFGYDNVDAFLCRPAGSGTHGTPCSGSTECAPGYVCDAESETSRVCHKYCRPGHDEDCAEIGGTSCEEVNSFIDPLVRPTTPVGLCVPVQTSTGRCTNFASGGGIDPVRDCTSAGEYCDPEPGSPGGDCTAGDGCDVLTQTGCASSGETCHPVGIFQVDNTDATLCMPAGSLVQGQTCTDTQQCAKGYSCVFNSASGGVCERYCVPGDDSNPCPFGTECTDRTSGLPASVRPSTPFGTCH